MVVEVVWEGAAGGLVDVCVGWSCVGLVLIFVKGDG